MVKQKKTDSRRRLTLGERWDKDEKLEAKGGTLFRLIKPYPGFKPKSKTSPLENGNTAISDKTSELLRKLKG